jgi:hypothetical protein
MSQFGLVDLFDHAFLAFPLAEGGVLHLPCGTVPSALVESEVQGVVVTKIIIMMAGADPMIFRANMTSAEVQGVFRDGIHQLNRVREEDLGEVKPFKPS